MAIYTAAFSAVAVAAAQDVFELVAPEDSQVALRAVRLGQYSDAADAQAEMLSVTLVRGHTTSGAGGAAVTPANLRPEAGAKPGAATVARNNTTLAANGAPVTLIADSWNVQRGWRYCPRADERIVLQNGQRLVVRITAPADEVTLNGTITFEELGQIPA
jgi:hypothetical protein